MTETPTSNDYHATFIATLTNLMAYSKFTLHLERELVLDKAMVTGRCHVQMVCLFLLQKVGSAV